MVSIAIKISAHLVDDIAMATKMMALRRDDVCSLCSTPLPAKTTASWDSVARVVTCISCVEPEATPLDSQLPPARRADDVRRSAPRLAPDTPPTEPDTGVAGGSAQREYDRRKQRHTDKIEERWGTGKIGSIAKFVATEPQSTTAWAKGAEGERQLASKLARNLGDDAVVLNDRKVPGTRGNLDHLVIGPSGVWIVDAKNYKGKVERRDVGGWFKTDVRLYVNGRDRSKIVAGMTWQYDAVRKALASTPFADVPVHKALCFTDSEWGLLSKAGQVDDVWILWAKKVVELVRTPAALDPETVSSVAALLSQKLPPT